jgi:hypothetical protein
MSQNEWRKISDINPNFPTPLLTSEGTGPEGDAPVVLCKGEGPFLSASHHHKMGFPNVKRTWYHGLFSKSWMKRDVISDCCFFANSFLSAKKRKIGTS